MVVLIKRIEKIDTKKGKKLMNGKKKRLIGMLGKE